MKVRVTGLLRGAKDSAADYNRPLKSLETLGFARPLHHASLLLLRGNYCYYCPHLLPFSTIVSNRFQLSSITRPKSNKIWSTSLLNPLPSFSAL